MNNPYCKAEAFPLRTWIYKVDEQDEYEAITYMGEGSALIELKYDVAYSEDKAKEMAQAQFLGVFNALELVFNAGRDSK